MSKLTLEEVDPYIQECINYGKKCARLPPDFTMTKKSKETLKDLIMMKIEDPEYNNKDISQSVVAYLRGYAEGIEDMADFVDKLGLKI